ncbi:MAG: neuraminidase-like domain-containing protein [Nitrospira sp.]
MRGKATTDKSSKDVVVDGGETYVVFGTVTNTDTTPAAGVTVIAYDKDESRENRLGQATTDQTGTYMIPYREADFRRSPKERGGADVIVRVYNEKNEMLFTSKKKNNAPAKYELNIQLLTQQYVVRGTVKDANDKPLPNMIVRVFERDLRYPQLIAEGSTGVGGDFRFEYRSTDFQLGDLPAPRAPWLIVEVREIPQGKVLAKQEVQRAVRDQIVSFALSNVGAISEWQRISEAVAPLLKGQGAARIEGGTRGDSATVNRDLAPWELTPEDVDFIVRDAELDRVAVEAWVASSQMVREVERRLTDEYPAQQGMVREIGWPFLYAMARQEQVKDLDVLLREPAESVRRAVKTAAFSHRISSLNEKQVEVFIDVLRLIDRLQQLDPVRSSNSDFAKLLGNLATPLPKVVALDALAVVQGKGLYDTDALLKLAERHPDAEAPIRIFVRSVRVHQLTSGHEGLSHVLNVRLEGESDSIAPLARLRATDWIGMAGEAGMSPGLALQTQAQVENQHPLTALESKIHAGLFDLPGVPGSEVAVLIKNQPALVENILLGKMPVKEGESTTYQALRNTGRFMRTGVSLELAADLIKGGIGSPGVALRYGRDHLRKQYQDRLPEDATNEVLDGFFSYMDGLVQGGKGLTIEIDLNRREPTYYRQKDLEEYKVPLPEPVRENAPTLAALFGDLDECLCRPCESMLGQPAYLVDLLNLLAKSTGTSGNALDELRSRRPDIFKLDLNCENAEQTIQHIDIVLEILEKAAALEAAPDATAEAIQQIAYPKLHRAIYPWHLPFDRGYDEASAYLAKLGVSREKLLGQRRDTMPTHLAAESLHAPIDQAGDPNADSQWELLTQQRLGARLWAAYGFNIDNDIRIVDPASRELLTNQTVQDVLTRVSFLIDRTGLSLDELEQSLQTAFVSGNANGIALSGREQCKTSAMRLPAQGSVLEGILDRLHRFTRVRAKLPGWSVKDLGRAIVVCDGIESAATTDQQRADVLVKVTIITRLHDDHGLSLGALIERPISEAYLRKALGLSLLQLDLLNEITGYSSAQVTDWFALKGFCDAAKRLREIGLAVEQAAQALLSRGRWPAAAGELPSSIKTGAQIEELLGQVQQRLRSIVAVRSDLDLEAQTVEALNGIFDRAIAGQIIRVIRDASDPAGTAPGAQVLAELVKALSGAAGHRLGEWLPLMDAQQAGAVFRVAATNNPGADERFASLLTAIVFRRRERELIAVLADQSGLAETDVIFLLGTRLLLDPVQGQPLYAYEAFLDGSFWADVSSTQPNPPSVTATAMPRLHAWIDRLYRLITLRTALAIDNELMQIADRVTVGSSVGINWRDMLGVVPAAGSTAWRNPQWQALLDLLWLQQPDQLSRPALGELLNRLAAPSAQVSVVTLRPLTSRVDIVETLAVSLIAQSLSVQPNTISTLDLRNPGKLRLAFQWLLSARHLGADSTQIARLINLADNGLAAGAAKSLLDARLAGDDAQASLQKIGDSLRRPRRAALVAFHTAQVVGRNNSDKWSNAKALYEHFLIDHQMEPCFETTRIVEAVTAVQLFAQRILFGIEPEITADPELKRRWIWMRNYRVWEANRKVFLFPENWLFPELRDDKSSSFKQLESALGQGELTQDLANQAFGKFLDDVAQMGQVQVLGMYEDVSHDSQGNILKDNNQIPLRRTLYVVGRTPNPPYVYFWRHCVDFGNPYMEWSPWQRIELDIQGDHVLPFVFNGQFYVAWPKFQQKDAKDKPDLLDLRMYWSRLNGVNWDRVENSREPIEILIPAFQDERTGYSFRCQQLAGAVTLICYRRASTGTLTSSQTQGVISERLRDLDDDLRQEFNARCWQSQNRYNSFGHNVVPAHDNYPTQVTGLDGGLPSGAPVIGAVLIVDWEVWVQAKDINGTVGYVRLDSVQRSRMNFSINAMVDGKPCFAQRIDHSIGIWVAVYPNAPQSVPDVYLSVTVNGATNQGSRQLLSGVLPNKMKEVRLKFVCEFSLNSIPTLADLGVESANRFEAVCQFLIQANGSKTWMNPYQTQRDIPLLNGFQVSMNGQEAAATALPITLQGENGQSALVPFQAPFRTTGTIWLTGGNSHLSPTAAPNVWFYRGGNRSCLLDTAKYNSNSGQKFDAIAFSYDDAEKYRQGWGEGADQFEFNPSWGKFGTDELSDLSATGNTTYWVRQRAGEMAFDARMPYACYNWEVFLHAPLLIADQLSKQHKFEDAERWLRFVFDPTNSEPGLDAKRFLKFRVFKELNLNQQVIDDLTALAQTAGGFATGADIAVVNKLIDRWRDMPFRPFVIARRRHIAFLWRTLFAYLDNLIAWADSLYRRDTRESINEATMLYVLAERILGRRPQVHQDKSNRPASTYDENITKWDEFANFWIDVGAQGHSNLQAAWRPKDSINQPSVDGMLYFCMPFNDKILSYWNTVDARLSNIRNCRSIEGIQRKLPLMDAPIDPELLVRATAAGLDLGDVIAGRYAPPPHYRYGILSSRAAELANECKSLGAAMLSAIEKRDAEYLAQLRSSNELTLLKLVRDVRELQIDEAERNIEALRASRRSIESRYNQYQRLLGKKDIQLPKEHESRGEEAMLGAIDSGMASNRSNWGLIKEENEQYVGIDGANTWATASGIAKILGGGFHASASIVLATPAGVTNAPKVLEALGTSASYIGDAFSMVSQGWKTYAEQQGMIAGHLRRRDEWAFQNNQTLRELQQIDKQILANQIRIDITQKELDNHIEQIEQAKAVDEVMRSKFSNVQLYEWMKTDLSRLYFNAYRMAVDMARRAERAASRELGVKPLNIVRNDHWDSLRDGLLAGERLHQDLKRLEIAYLDQNRREYELTKHISLRRLDPEALVQLRVKAAGCTCEFNIPEWLFDLDTPGLYLRRIKSASVSIPSVAGPFTSVNCKLTLLKSEVRHANTASTGVDYLRSASGDDRFTDYFGATEAIMTSTGNADSGMFETQLRDERFLPFEGSGVISTWRLELPAEYPQFDYSTISDVVLTIRYTARDGGDSLRNTATAAIDTRLAPSSSSTAAPLRFPVVLSSRADFSTEWARAGTTSDLKISFTRSLLPYWMDAAGLVVREVLVADLPKAAQSPLDFKLVWPPQIGVTDPALWPADALNGDGAGEGNFGRVIGVIDKIILLNVGVRTNPSPSPP